MDEKEIIARATSVVSDTRAGLLTTVGLDGRPNVRWMATHALLGSLNTLYTITAPDSNKAGEIEKDPRVTWLYTRVNFTEIVKLYGEATLEGDPLLKSKIWDIVGKKTFRYFTMREGDPEFSVLTSKIHTIEYMSPAQKIFQPVTVELPHKG